MGFKGVFIARTCFPDVISEENLSNLNITINDMFCGNITEPPGLGAKEDVMCPEPLNGKIVKIQKMAKSILNLAEVKLIYTNDRC